MKVHFRISMEVRDEETANDFSWIIENIGVFVGDNVWVDWSKEGEARSEES